MAHVDRCQPIACIPRRQIAAVGGQVQLGFACFLHQEPRDAARGIATSGRGRAVGVEERQMRISRAIGDHGQLVKAHAELAMSDGLRKGRGHLRERRGAVGTRIQHDLFARV